MLTRAIFDHLLNNYIVSTIELVVRVLPISITTGILLALTYTASTQSTTEDPSVYGSGSNTTDGSGFTTTDGGQTLDGSSSFGSTTTDSEQPWDDLLPSIIEERCFPVYELVNEGCYRGCISFNLTTNCHFCNTTCNGQY